MTQSYFNAPAFDAAAIKDSKLQKLHAYWEAIAPAGNIPGRQHFEPADIVDLLPWIMLFDVDREARHVHGPRFRYRLVGTGVTGATGQDTTGAWLDEIPKTGDAEARLHVLAETGVPYYLEDVTAVWAAQEFRRYSVLALPLSRDGEVVDMVLMGLAFDKPADDDTVAPQQ